MRHYASNPPDWSDVHVCHHCDQLVRDTQCHDCLEYDMQLTRAWLNRTPVTPTRSHPPQMHCSGCGAHLQFQPSSNRSICINPACDLNEANKLPAFNAPAVEERILPRRMPSMAPAYWVVPGHYMGVTALPDKVRREEGVTICRDCVRLIIGGTPPITTIYCHDDPKITLQPITERRQLYGMTCGDCGTKLITHR